LGISKLTPIPKQALVVEDDPAVRRMVRGFLVHMKYVVTEAPDGKKALTALSNGKFDLVLLDLMLPESSGYDVLEHIRDQGLKVPVVMMSARSLPEDRAHAEELGARLYLIKPFTRTDFSQAIRSVMEGQA
jgi:two-component system chemotaxis response regulator CheY